MSMHPALILLVYALAVARATRLVTEDRITLAPREWLVRRLWLRETGDLHTAMMAAADPDADPPLGVYLLRCPWCVSIWLGALAAPVAYFWGAEPWFFVPALALAFSYFTGFAAGRE